MIFHLEGKERWHFREWRHNEGKEIARNFKSCGQGFCEFIGRLAQKFKLRILTSSTNYIMRCHIFWS